MHKIYRVAVIGSTDRGNYGHRLDTAFKDLDRAQIVAVADADAEGLDAAGKKLLLDDLYTDYREMLTAVRPDIAVVCPGWVSDRLPMIEAATEAGCHIYCEKPLAGRLAGTDAIIAACNKAGIKMALAHQWRGMPVIQRIIAEVNAGTYGKLLRLTARPKDDSRGGGEELLLHGTHLFDLMMAFAGPPRWAGGHVAVAGRDATKADVGEGNSPVGPIAGDSISAIFGFDDGVRGYFETTAGLAGPDAPGFDNLYGLSLECEKAALELREPGDAHIYPAPRVLPDHGNLSWEKYHLDGWHDRPENTADYLRKNWLSLGNRALALDLIDAIDTDREPLSSVHQVRFVNEMVQGVYASHLAGGQRVELPLVDRVHPLDS